MLFIQCNIYLFSASYKPLTNMTGGKTKLVDSRQDSLFEVLTGEPPATIDHHKALQDSLVLTRLFWRFVKEGKGPQFYPIQIKYFHANLHRLDLQATVEYFANIKERRSQRPPVKSNRGVFFLPLGPLSSFLTSTTETRCDISSGGNIITIRPPIIRPLISSLASASPGPQSNTSSPRPARPNYYPS